MEIWKDIPGYEGLYQASSYGRIKSMARVVFGKRQKTIHERVLSPVPFTNGYLGVQLCNFGVKRWTIHRLVCMAFYGVPDEKQHVDHIDYCKTNNSVDNLRWISNIENQRHSRINKTGIKLNNKKLCMHYEIGYFCTCNEAAINSGYCRSQMSLMLNGKMPNKTKYILV